jgi:hypothetical protein
MVDAGKVQLPRRRAGLHRPGADTG